MAFAIETLEPPLAQGFRFARLIFSPPSLSAPSSLWNSRPSQQNNAQPFINKTRNAQTMTFNFRDMCSNISLRSRVVLPRHASQGLSGDGIMLPRLAPQHAKSGNCSRCRSTVPSYLKSSFFRQIRTRSHAGV